MIPEIFKESKKALIILLAVILAGVFLVLGFVHPTSNHVSTEDGLAYLEEQSSKNTADVQTRIQNLTATQAGTGTETAQAGTGTETAQAGTGAETAQAGTGTETEQTGAAGTENAQTGAAADTAQTDTAAAIDMSDDQRFKAMYANSNSIVMGDSNAHTILEVDLLYESNVIAESGVCLYGTDEHIAQAAALAPSNIFLYYGFNDVAVCGTDYDEYYAEYTELVQKLKAACPNAVIYVNALFPCLHLDGVMNGNYADLTPYNDIIYRVCQENGLIWMDNSDLAQPEYYYEDGYHFNYDFMVLWLQRMADWGGFGGT